MNLELISEALTNVSAEYIGEAAGYTKAAKIISPRYKFIKYSSFAACICLIVTSLLAAYSLGLFDTPRGELNGSTAPDDGIQDGCDAEINDENNNNSPDNEVCGDEGTHASILTVSRDGLRMQITDAFTDTEGRDGLRITLYNESDADEIFLRSSKEVLGQAITHISPTDAEIQIDVEGGIFCLALPKRTKITCEVFFEKDSFELGKYTTAAGEMMKVVFELALKNDDSDFKDVRVITDFSKIETK